MGKNLLQAVIVSEMTKEFLVGWPALVRAGLGSEWERSRSQSDTIIDPSRSQSLTTQTFPDTEPAPEPVSKVGARDSPPSHYAVTQWARVKTTPCQWPPVGLAIRWTVSRHWVWSVVCTLRDISDPGAVTTAGSLQCPHHCSSWSLGLGLAPCRAHWPVRFTSRQRSTKQEKSWNWDYLDTDVLLSESKYSFGCFPRTFHLDFVPFGNLFACCLNILVWKRREKFGNKVMESLFFWQYLCLSWSDLEDRWALVLGHVMQLLWGLAGGALHVMQCNAVYHHGASAQYHDCLFSPCTQKYRLRIRVKLIFSISEEAGDLVTRDTASWPPPVPHVSQDGVLRVCQGNFTVGDRFAK